MKTTWRAKSFSAVFSSVVAMLCLAGPAFGQPFEWRSATPESQGMSKEKLDALKDELAKRKTLKLDDLTDEEQIEAEDDYRICVRRGSVEEAKPKRKQRKTREEGDE